MSSYAWVGLSAPPTLGTALPARLPESTGTIYYVDKAIGSDSNNSTQAQSVSTPWATVAHAIATATSAGSIIRVRAGRYNEDLVWSATGGSSNPITLERYPGENPVLARSIQMTGSYLRLRGFRCECSPNTPNGRAVVWFKSPAAHCEAYGLDVTHPAPDRPTLANQATTGGFLTGNTKYYYRVAAVTSEGTTIPGFEASITTAAGTNTNVIRLTWNAWTPPTSVTLTGYKVYRSTSVGSELLLATLGNVTTYDDNTNTTPSGTFLTQSSGVYWGDAPGVTDCQLWNSHIHNCGTDRNLDHGTYTGYADGAVVANCIAHDNYCHGIKFAPYVFNSYFVNNTSYHNGYGPAVGDQVGSGMICGSDPIYSNHNSIFRNNICKDNFSYGFRDFWDVSTVTGNTHTTTTIDSMTNPNGAFVGAPIVGTGIPQNPLGTHYADDSFARTVSNGWGTADTGGSWTVRNGSTSAFSVGSSTAKIAHAGTTNVESITFPASSAADVDVACKFAWDTNVAIVGNENDYTVLARWADASNFYRARLSHFNSGEVDLYIDKVISGSTTVLAGAKIVVGTYTLNDFYWLRFRIYSTSLYAKAWKDGTAEPAAWMRTATDSSISAGGAIGVRVASSASETSTPTLTVDTLSVDQSLASVETHIATVPTASSITIDQAATSTNTGVTLTIGGDVTADTNIVHGNGTAGVGIFTNVPHVFNVAAGNLASDPKLNDPANGDFTLQSTSPARNYGDSTFCPTIDYNGNLRVVCDAGAYRY